MRRSFISRQIDDSETLNKAFLEECITTVSGMNFLKIKNNYYVKHSLKKYIYVLETENLLLRTTSQKTILSGCFLKFFLKTCFKNTYQLSSQRNLPVIENNLLR